MDVRRESTNLGQRLLKSLEDIYRKDDWRDADLTIFVRGKCFQAHKLIMSLYTTYFEAPKGGIVNDFKAIHYMPPEIEAETFELLLQYMYTGRVNCRSEQDQKLVRLGHVLHIGDLMADDVKTTTTRTRRGSGSSTGSLTDLVASTEELPLEVRKLLASGGETKTIQQGPYNKRQKKSGNPDSPVSPEQISPQQATSKAVVNSNGNTPAPSAEISPLATSVKANMSLNNKAPSSVSQGLGQPSTSKTIPNSNMTNNGCLPRVQHQASSSLNGKKPFHPRNLIRVPPYNKPPVFARAVTSQTSPNQLISKPSPTIGNIGGMRMLQNPVVLRSNPQVNGQSPAPRILSSLSGFQSRPPGRQLVGLPPDRLSSLKSKQMQGPPFNSTSNLNLNITNNGGDSKDNIRQSISLALQPLAKRPKMASHTTPQTSGVSKASTTPLSSQHVVLPPNLIANQSGVIRPLVQANSANTQRALTTNQSETAGKSGNLPGKLPLKISQPQGAVKNEVNSDDEIDNLIKAQSK